MCARAKIVAANEDVTVYSCNLSRLQGNKGLVQHVRYSPTTHLYTAEQIVEVY